MKIHIEWQCQFGKWHHYQVKHNQADAFRVASLRSQTTGKRHRLLSDDGSLLDVVTPL